MGVVYLGRDERLGWDVAIKALPEQLASDPVRLERFEREAKFLAQLNRPNVAGIHGVEEQDGQKHLILRFVEGETLGERLNGGPTPVDEAIEIEVEIAAGLEAVREAGVIHRDLKPDTIKIGPEGKVWILDFGLAPTAASAPRAWIALRGHQEGLLGGPCSHRAHTSRLRYAAPPRRSRRA